MKNIILIYMFVLPYLGYGQGLSDNNRSLNRYYQKRDSLKTLLESVQEELKLIEDTIESINFELSQHELKNDKDVLISVEEINDNADVRLKGSYAYEVIGKIVKGSKVEVLDVESDFYKIKYLGQIGYVEHRYINDDHLNELAKDANDNSRFNYLKKKFGVTNAKRIMNGQVWIGMTDDMARLSKGSPDDINRTEFAWGIHEQWVYDSYSNDLYLYFEDGILTTIQD